MASNSAELQNIRSKLHQLKTIHMVNVFRDITELDARLTSLEGRISAIEEHLFPGTTPQQEASQGVALELLKQVTLLLEKNAQKEVRILECIQGRNK